MCQWQQVYIPARLMLGRIMAQSGHNHRAQTLRLTIRRWVILGSGNIFQSERTVDSHEKVGDKLRAIFWK